MISNIYAQCNDSDQPQCSNDDSCEWIEDIANISCSGFTVETCNMQDECFLDQDCAQWGSWYSWICYDYGPLYCSGSYEVDNSYCQEVEMPECSGMDEMECSSNDCEWILDIEIGNCSDINNGSECYQTNQCLWYSAGNYGYMYDNCYGGTYEVDNSYCQEIEMLECPEMNELQCDNEDTCEWVEAEVDCQNLNTESNCNSYDCDWIQDIEWGSCGDLNPTWWQGVQFCDDPSSNLDNCYTYTCYGGGYGQWNTCCGGDPYIINDNSYCDGEVSYCEEIEYQLGDLNQDNVINIQDVIMVIDLILHGEFDLTADLNLDSSVNVVDVIQLVSMILN